MSFPDADRDRQRERFVAYRNTGDERIRDELFDANRPLAVHLARRFANRGVPTDDLEQVAAMGLLHAIERFEPARGLEFSTFATPTILGELKRHFRDKGWSVRVPRRVQELHVRLNVVVADLSQRHGRSPTIRELAVATRTSEEEVLEAMEASQAYRTQSLDGGGGSGGDDHDPNHHLGQDDERMFRIEARDEVERLIATLPAREQLMLRLRFYEEMTQSEIAQRLGISQMHVSRLLARCLADLRVALARAHDRPPDPGT